MSRFLAFYALAGLLELPFLAPLSRGDPGFYSGWMWLAHGAAVLLVFFSVARGKGFWEASHLWSRNFIFLMLPFPLMGWAIVGILFLSYEISKKERFSNLPEEESFFDESASRDFQEVPPASGQRILEELDFMSLADILEGDDLALKRGAIERLIQLKTPEAVSLLVKQRSSPSPEIRFWASSALTRVKKEFDEELHAVKEEFQKDIHNPLVRLSLAKCYLSYVKSGLFDPETNQWYGKEALHHLRALADSNKADEEVYWILGDLYQSQGNYAQAQELIELLQSRTSLDSRKMIQAQVVNLYNQARYQEMIGELEKLKSLGFPTPGWVATANWWGVC